MGEKSLGEALQQFIKNSRFKNDIQAFQIKEVWENIMGKTVAKYTEKIQIIGKTLFITTPVAPLKNELSFQKETIIKRVNEAIGEQLINEVVIK
jgi:predicted nucleic acid-binding Zn ribbon protein